MKNLIIIGARGFGTDMYDLALKCEGYQKDYKIKGFLDKNKDVLSRFNNYKPILGSYEEYRIVKNDVFICAFGEVNEKKKCIEVMEEKDADFISLIHPSAHIGSNTIINKGCIVSNNAFIGSQSIINEYALIQTNAIIGHNVKIGKFSRVDCFTVCVGGVVIKDEVTIHTSAVINKNLVVHSRSTVGTGSFVIRDVMENTTVFGCPAKRL
jgi:sugar O-acyltransferase (sialic acid O-acetyltransferase NeuD family)